ncbi:MAG: DUF483 domain-containing protein [Candidatus Saganbacteria bacterium]|nr:DUF483 domain-containing protein [Candidatus Saganbacteria bacterium]
MLKGVNISQVFGGLLCRNEILQLLFLLSGAKQAIRIVIRQKDLLYVRTLLLELNLSVERSDFFAVSRAVRGHYYTYKKADVSKDNKELVFLYVSKRAKVSLELKKSEAEEDSFKFGKLLGYPSCCIKKYLKTKINQIGDFIMISSAKSKIQTYPFLNNVALGIFGIRVISHFPCSLNCRNSLKIGKQYARVLEEIDYNYFKFLKEELKSLVVVFRSGSLIYSKKFIKEGKNIEIKELQGDGQDPLYIKMSKRKSFCLNDLIKDNSHVNNVDYRVFVFSEIY